MARGKAKEPVQAGDVQGNLEAQEAAGTVTSQENEEATAHAQESVRDQEDRKGVVDYDAEQREGFGKLEPNDDNQATVQPRRYASGEGLEAGNAASETLYVDADGNVTSDPPERGKVLTVKGQPVTPAAARQIADSKGA